MVESLQHKLDRVRPPRVQITYDVEIGDAIIMKELPFVVGIMADLSGKLIDPLPKVKARKFVDIDRDNIEHIMKSIRPRVVLRVANKVNAQEEHMSAELFFEDISDFEPINVIKQIPEINKLYQARIRLKDLMTKLDGNDALDDMLREIITNPDKRAALKAELGIDDAPPAAPAPTPSPASA